MISFVVLCILGSNESVYLKVLRDVLCEISNLNNWWIMLYFEYSVDALTIKWKIISRSKETKMKRKRKAFVKVFKKLVGSC